jgi:hypothetical protein
LLSSAPRCRCRLNSNVRPHSTTMMPAEALEDLPTVPPALLLMLREFTPGKDWSAVRKNIRAALRDMKDQSLSFESQNVSRSEAHDPLRFEVHPHGALDLLSGHGCIDLDCRVAAAERLSRSLGLFADRIWLTDHLSTEVMTVGRATNEAIDHPMHHAVALAPLLPLMKAGIVRFRSPWIATCEECSHEFDTNVESITREVIRLFSRQIAIEQKESGGYFARTGSIFEPPVMLHGYRADGSVPSRREFAEHLVAREIREIMWASREATFTRGAVFSNSRAALAGLLQCDGRLPQSAADLRIFEDGRALDIPWVSELSPAQVLQLREEASQAIPLFREMLARATSPGASDSSPSPSSSLIADLRAQAAEVRAELTVKKSKSARYWRTAFGLLGLRISAYGVASDQPLTGLGGLLPILQLLIEHRTGHESDAEKIKTRPGYVLVKAQDILAHAH